MASGTLIKFKSKWFRGTIESQSENKEAKALARKIRAQCTNHYHYFTPVSLKQKETSNGLVYILSIETSPSLSYDLTYEDITQKATLTCKIPKTVLDSCFPRDFQLSMMTNDFEVVTKKLWEVKSSESTQCSNKKEVLTNIANANGSISPCFYKEKSNE